MLAKERSGKTPIEIHGLLVARRGRKGIKPPNLTQAKTLYTNRNPGRPQEFLGAFRLEKPH